MVKNQLKNLMLWVIAVVVLLQTAQCHITKSIWAENKHFIADKKINQKAALNAEEIDEFIQLWPQFKELKLQAPTAKSLSIEKEHQSVDWKTKIWFIYHKLDIERFMYVRQRLEDLIKQIEIKRSAEAVVKQMMIRKDELSRDMAEQHRRRADAIILDAEEVKIIEERAETLKQLFRLYP